MLGKGIAKKSCDKTMNILRVIESENRKTWAEATDSQTGEKIAAPQDQLTDLLTDGRRYKIRHIEPKGNHRREIQEIVQQLTGKFRCVDY